MSIEDKAMLGLLALTALALGSAALTIWFH